MTECSFRHPRSCRYFREYKYCKFGEYCKFKHRAFENGNDEEINVIKKKLEELKDEIKTKDEEIKLKNHEIELMNKKAYEKVAKLENKIDKMEKLFNELKKENDIIKEMIHSKAKESEEIVQVEAIIESENYICNECDFVGKTEPGLKVISTLNQY